MGRVASSFASRGIQRLVRRLRGHGQRDAVGRGHADQRRTADLHPPDALGRVVDAPPALDHEPVGQVPLVDDRHELTVPPDRPLHVRLAHHHRSTLALDLPGGSGRAPSGWAPTTQHPRGTLTVRGEPGSVARSPPTLRGARRRSLPSNTHRSPRPARAGPLLVLLALVGGGCRESPPPSSRPASPTGTPVLEANATIVRVVDGDTVDVSIGGRRERVRLIGIDTPETKDPDKPVECYGPEASALTESAPARGARPSGWSAMSSRGTTTDACSPTSTAPRTACSSTWTWPAVGPPRSSRSGRTWPTPPSSPPRSRRPGAPTGGRWRACPST